MVDSPKTSPSAGRAARINSQPQSEPRRRLASQHPSQAKLTARLSLGQDRTGPHSAREAKSRRTPPVCVGDSRQHQTLRFITCEVLLQCILEKHRTSITPVISLRLLARLFDLKYYVNYNTSGTQGEGNPLLDPPMGIQNAQSCKSSTI